MIKIVAAAVGLDEIHRESLGRLLRRLEKVKVSWR